MLGHTKIVLAVLATVWLTPKADANLLRHLGAMHVTSPTCNIQDGVDYVDNDFDNLPGAVTTCCDTCAAFPRCNAWSWSNANGGTCWLKTGMTKSVTNPNVKSAQFLWNGGVKYCRIDDNVDYPGNDLSHVPAVRGESCCAICKSTNGCAAFTWSDYQGGTCWLKSQFGPATYKAGARSARVGLDVLFTCNPMTTNADYQGMDIANKPSASADGCCDLCKQTTGCRAFTWTNYNGGTCWLKNLIGNIVYKQGAISGHWDYNPDPACTFQSNVDFVDNDLANVPSKDPYLCCSVCREYPGCKAVAWSNMNGGTCWLKSAKGTVISKPGVVATAI